MCLRAKIVIGFVSLFLADNSEGEVRPVDMLILDGDTSTTANQIELSLNFSCIVYLLDWNIYLLDRYTVSQLVIQVEESDDPTVDVS